MICGMDIEGNEAIIALCDNTDGELIFVKSKFKKIALDATNQEHFQSFYETFCSFIKQNNIERIYLKKPADKGQRTAGPNAFRIEALLNLSPVPVISVHAIADGWAYFITDEHRNGNIDDVLEKGLIDTTTAIRIIRGIINGVGALHASPNCLLHRDLKPANILLDNSMSPIIADFGSIKRMPKNASEVVASQHSVLYRPPESFECGKYYYTSDIYQIGLVFYQLLGGYLPYEPEHYMTKSQIKQYLAFDSIFDQSPFVDTCLFNKARKEKLLSYASLPTYTDKRLIQIIKKATKANHEKRYENIADIQLALHSVGNLPNWYRSDTFLFCENCGCRYRIREVRNNRYQIEREYTKLKWSKLRSSSVYDTEKDAIEYLKSYIS